MNKKEFNSERLSIQAKQRGYYVNIYDDKWKLDNNNNINVGAVSRIINPELIDGYLNTLSFMPEIIVQLMYVKLMVL